MFKCLAYDCGFSCHVLKYTNAPRLQFVIHIMLSDQFLQHVHNPVARTPDVGRPVLRRCLDIHDPIFKHALIISALLQLIHDPEPDLILVHGLLVSLLQHVILGESLPLKRRYKALEVLQRGNPELLLPLAVPRRWWLASGRVGGDGGEVALEIGVELQHRQAEDRLYLRLDIANRGFVLLFDATLGVKVQRRTTVGVGGHTSVVDGGGELVAYAAQVAAEVLTGKNETKHAAADFAARVADLGVCGLLEGHDVGGGKAVELGFCVGTVLLEIFRDASGGLLTVSLRLKAMLAYVRERGGNVVGWKRVLGEHLARTFFSKAVVCKSKEVAGVEVDFPRLTEDRGEIGFELGNLGFELVAN